MFQQADNHYDSHLLQLNANHPAGDILVLGNEESNWEAAPASKLPDEVLNRVSAEWSVNGKVWTAFTPDGIAGQEMVYVRLHNTSAESYRLPMDKMVMHMSGSDYLEAKSVRTVSIRTNTRCTPLDLDLALRL